MQLPSLKQLGVGQEWVLGGFAHLTGIAAALPPLVKQRPVFYLARSRGEADWLKAAVRFFSKEVQAELWTSEAFGAALLADCLIGYPDSVDTTVWSPRELREKSIFLTKGPRTQSQLIERLAVAGFERGKTAETPGHFSVKGELIEIQMTEQLKARLRWEYDRLVELRVNEKSVNQLTLYPVRLGGPGIYTILDLVRDRLVMREEDTPLASRRLAILSLSHFMLSGQPAVHQRRLPTTAVGLDELRDHLNRARRVQVATQFLTEAKKILSPIQPPVTWTATDLELEGFCDSDQQWCLVTDEDLFLGRRKKPTSAFQLALKPGDYVVHVYHGIGRFTGTTVMVVNNRPRDYLILEYAERDKLYVPVENADRVEKYVGAAHPKIHRLHDVSWETVVRRVREDALELARQLLAAQAARQLAHAPTLKPHPEIEDRVMAGFGFALTKDQVEALHQIELDLGKPTPMDRLLCGDVGFGKTEVALRAAARTLANGYQVAVLAPTTVLVQQHLDTFQRRLKPLGFRIDLLSRFRSPADQRRTIRGLTDGSVQLIVGTHRLLSKDVHFHRLGLIIIDEEQRFGVRHKELLRKIRSNAHVLTLSATPLPRTLHFALSGLRGISTITTPPAGRLGIESQVAPYDPAVVRSAIQREINRRGQIYFLHNDVDTIQAKARELAEWFPGAKIGIAHGQLPDEQLAHVMHQFDEHWIDVLVCSTIIENGLDIPAANTLIVERATQFGLSQLHQLRGRIGRGRIQAYAYFFYHSRDLSDEAKQRLKALEEAQELGAGFEIALRDMEIRGVGSILGREQHGHAEAIGLNYYSRLLAGAVEELKTGQTPTPIRDIPIDLPLTAVIPESVVPDEAERIRLYQAWAAIRDQDELTRISNTWAERAPELRELFQLLQIRLAAQASDLISIDTIYPSEKIVLKSLHPIPYGVIQPPYERVDDRTTRVYKNQLGPNWVAALTRWISGLPRS